MDEGPQVGLRGAGEARVVGLPREDAVAEVQAPDAQAEVGVDSVCVYVGVR